MDLHVKLDWDSSSLAILPTTPLSQEQKQACKFQKHNSILLNQRGFNYVVAMDMVMGTLSCPDHFCKLLRYVVNDPGVLDEVNEPSLPWCGQATVAYTELLEISGGSSEAKKLGLNNRKWSNVCELGTSKFEFSNCLSMVIEIWHDLIFKWQLYISSRLYSYKSSNSEEKRNIFQRYLVVDVAVAALWVSFRALKHIPTLMERPCRSSVLRRAKVSWQPQPPKIFNSAKNLESM